MWHPTCSVLILIISCKVKLNCYSDRVSINNNNENKRTSTIKCKHKTLVK